MYIFLHKKTYRSLTVKEKETVEVEHLINKERETKKPENEKWDILFEILEKLEEQEIKDFLKDRNQPRNSWKV